MKHCVLLVLGTENPNANAKNIFLLSKIQNYLFLSSLYQQNATKNYQHFLAKGLKNQFAEMSIKQKLRIKIRQMSVNILLNQTL